MKKWVNIKNLLKNEDIDFDLCFSRKIEMVL